MDAPRRQFRLIVGVVLLALGTALGGWIAAAEPFAWDSMWNQTLAGWRMEALVVFSLVMNWLGGGWIGVIVVPIGTAFALYIQHRRWAAAYFLIASAAGALVVQLLKHLIGRARPEDILVMADVGSYPSGHVANAAVVAFAAGVIWPRVWVRIAGASWLLLMAFSRTYLHAHWLSDSVGGAMVGAGVALVVAAAMARPIHRERMDVSGAAV